MILGLHWQIWVVLALYFAFMLYLGWRSKKGIHNQEGFLLGNRQFGVSMMVMHAFGAGTHPGDVAGVMGKTVTSGASGIWVSWMWMFGTPFYWLIAPIYRRMRCLTVADFFRERYGRLATVLYILVASTGMTVAVSSLLLATARTVQGIMGKAGPENEAWFFGILFISTFVFVIYSYWGGIVAAIKTDMLQGLMIIGLSFIAIPQALSLPEVNGLEGMRSILRAHSGNGSDYLSLFDPQSFNIWVVVMLCISAPFSIMAQPHTMSVTSAGRTEWEGRVGFCYGNILKRICTMGWCVLGLCWLARLTITGSDIHQDAAFGDSIRYLLPVSLQGLMLACVMAAAMSTGDAVQVTVAGLFSENLYKEYINPEASQERLMNVTRIVGIVIIACALVGAILMRASLVGAILDYFNITSLLGVAVVMGILWRRMNTWGMVTGLVAAVAMFILTKVYGSVLESEYNFPQRGFTIGLPMLSGILFGIYGSLMTPPPDEKALEPFFKRIYTPIGEEDKLNLPFDEAVPPHKRWLTKGDLLIMKPSRQSWIGFLVALAICLLCVWFMVWLLNGS